MTVRWWQWREVGTYPGKVTVANSTSLEASMQVPSDAAPGQTIHVVGEATGKGAPPLTRYQRLVIVVAR